MATAAAPTAKADGAKAPAGGKSGAGAPASKKGKAAKGDPPVCIVPSWRVATIACKGCKAANDAAKAQKPAEPKKGSPKPPPPVPDGLAQLWVVFRPRPGAGTAKQGDAGIKDASESVQQEIKQFESGSWSLGLTSDKGYLGPAVFDSKNWEKLVSAVNKGAGLCDANLASVLPDSFHFVPGQEYEFYFVQHPSRALAEKVQADLNAAERARKAGGAADQGKAAGANYGEPTVLAPDASGRIEVEESPAAFWPSRTYTGEKEQLYGGWCLFNGMPSRNCAKVREQVVRLEAHLGAMRYYVGDHEWPYVFHLPRPGEPSFNKCPDNHGDFDVRVMGAVYGFQQHARLCTPFQVDANPQAALIGPGPKFDPKISPAQRLGKEPLESSADTWSYLRGNYVESYADRAARLAAASKDPKTAPPAPSHTLELDAPTGAPDGVVDGSTARAIRKWLELRLRKPGEILVRFREYWMRPDLAKGIYAWHQLAKAMGCANGIQFGHTFRQTLHSGGGAGAAYCSIHKVGLAVDCSGHHYFHGDQDGWQVVYQVNPKDNLGDRLGWTVLGISNQVIPAAALTENGSQAQSALESVKRRVEAYTFENAEPELVAYADRARARLLDKLDSDGVKTFFRLAATPWFMDVANPAGGVTTSQEWSPEDCFDASGRFIAFQHYLLEVHKSRIKALEEEKKVEEARPDKSAARIAALDKAIADHRSAQASLEAAAKARPPAKAKAAAPAQESAGASGPSDGAVTDRRPHASFLDLTSLGAVAKMSNIHSTAKMKFVPTPYGSADLHNMADAIGGAVKQKAEDLSLAVDASLQKVLADQLDWLKARVERTIAGQTVPISFELDDFDPGFMSTWPDLLRRLLALVPGAKGDKGKAPKPEDYALITVASPQFTVQLSNKKGREADADKLVQLLNDKAFAERCFWVDPVPAVAGDSGDKARTGAQWAMYLTALAKKLRDARTAVVEPPGAKPEVVPASQAVAGAKEGGATPQTPELSRVTFQPVFLKRDRLGPLHEVVPNRVPCMVGDRVVVPTPGSEQCQEWWHFQRADMFKKVDLCASPGGVKPKIAVVGGAVLGEGGIDGKWSTLLALFGWSRECLAKGPQFALYGREGVGCSPKDLDKPAT